MRIKLIKGRQKELINLAKGNLSWKELSKILNLSGDYLRIDIRNEKVLLSNENYKKLCELTNNNFNKYIIEKLNDNWGKSKGGKNSSGNTKLFKEPIESKELAEIFGIILGDGNIDTFSKGKRIRCYIVKIVGDNRNDKEYLTKYVSKLFKDIFNEVGSTREVLKHHGIYLSIYGKNLINFLKLKGLKPGNKKNNNQSIPKWIKLKKDYSKFCIRGLIDTDGSVHYISRNNRNIRISFVSHIPNLLNDVRKMFIELGFNPSKIISERQIFLSSKKDIAKYIKEIGFKNSKHLKRFENLTNKAPVV